MSVDRTYTTTVGSQTVDLPLVPLSDDLTIALLICVDHGVAFAEVAGRELADLMRPAAPEIVVSVATMGIPLAIEASRALGLDDYVILHKTPKIHLGETWAEPVTSITTGCPPYVDAVWPWSTTSSRPGRRRWPRCGCSVVPERSRS
jgi:adenine phosphoribosyltransferase